MPCSRLGPEGSPHETYGGGGGGGGGVGKSKKQESVTSAAKRTHLFAMDSSRISKHFAFQSFGLPGNCLRGIPFSSRVPWTSLSALVGGREGGRDVGGGGGLGWYVGKSIYVVHWKWGKKVKETLWPHPPLLSLNDPNSCHDLSRVSRHEVACIIQRQP